MPGFSWAGGPGEGDSTADALLVLLSSDLII